MLIGFYVKQIKREDKRYFDMCTLSMAEFYQKTVIWTSTWTFFFFLHENHEPQTNLSWKLRKKKKKIRFDVSLITRCTLLSDG